MAGRQHRPRGPVDWAEIRQRVEAAGRALAGAVDTSPERVRQVLEERARALARPIAPAAAGETLDAVAFALAGETYAIESRYVIAVFRLQDLSPLPGAEPPVFGVTAWRGELLVILDLRSVLGLPVGALDDMSRVIVLGTEGAAFGILADAVHHLITLPAAEARGRPEGAAGHREYVLGITGDAVLVLDADKILHLHT